MNPTIRLVPGRILLCIDGFVIPSCANLREHWARRAKRVSAQRSAIWLALNSVRKGNAAQERRAGVSVRCPIPVPATITITRISPRSLDSDNLANACKAVRDGIADWLGLDDGDQRLVWRYEQRKGRPRQVAIEIAIEYGLAGQSGLEGV